MKKYTMFLLFLLLFSYTLVTEASVGNIKIVAVIVLGDIKRFEVGNILTMKKPHACSREALRFSVVALGSDVKIKCLSCGHEVRCPRVKLEKSIKSIDTE